MSRYIIERNSDNCAKKLTERARGDITKKKSYFVANRDHVFGYSFSIAFLFAYFVLPQYFGLDLPGFDLTAQRLFILLALIYILINKKRSYLFFYDIKKLPFIYPVLLNLFVLLYTAAYRVHVGTIMYNLIEFLGLFVFIYIVRYELGLNKAINLIHGYSYLLSLLGMVEYVMGKTPFSYLITIKGLYTGAHTRSGSYRIMGPANHSLAYGLMLIVMISLACVDMKKNKLDLFAKPILLALLIVNVFLTGSRSTLAVAGLEVLIIVILSEREVKKKTLIMIICTVVVLAFIVVVTYGSGFSNYIMLQITSVLDEMFGTTWSVNFGADIKTLSNSSNYRQYLPKIFSLPALNPFIGRGSQASFRWYVEGYLIESIDNFYVATYIRYAYPGLVTYILFMLSSILPIVYNAFKKKSGLYFALAIGVVCYFINLWWLDTLQTIKYAYILLGLYWANNIEDVKVGKEKCV